MKQVWRPTIGAGVKRKPLTPLRRIQPMHKKEDPKDLPEYEKVRLENIAEQRRLFIERLKQKARHPCSNLLSRSLLPIMYNIDAKSKSSENSMRRGCQGEIQ